jgi:hypothetical protein
MIGNFFQLTYMIFASMAQWFLNIGTSFFGGVGGWVSGWFA